MDDLVPTYLLGILFCPTSNLLCCHWTNFSWKKEQYHQRWNVLNSIKYKTSMNGYSSYVTVDYKLLHIWLSLPLFDVFQTLLRC